MGRTPRTTCTFLFMTHVTHASPPTAEQLPSHTGSLASEVRVGLRAPGQTRAEGISQNPMTDVTTRLWGVSGRATQRAPRTHRTLHTFSRLVGGSLSHSSGVSLIDTPQQDAPSWDRSAPTARRALPPAQPRSHDTGDTCDHRCRGAVRAGKQRHPGQLPDAAEQRTPQGRRAGTLAETPDLVPHVQSPTPTGSKAKQVPDPGPRRGQEGSSCRLRGGGPRRFPFNFGFLNIFLQNQKQN